MPAAPGIFRPQPVRPISMNDEMAKDYRVLKVNPLQEFSELPL